MSTEKSTDLTTTTTGATNPWAIYEKSTRPVDFNKGLNPYFHHIQCKCGTLGYFNIFKPVKANEKNPENKIEILNPEVVSSHRIVGLEGDVIEFKFGFAQSIMKAIDIEEGENPNIRCQTSKFEIYDSHGNVVAKRVDTKPLLDKVFSPKKSKKEPREPNSKIQSNMQQGYTINVFGQVDPKYAARVGIPSTRSCLDCVRAGTNIFVDKAESSGKPPLSYECKFTGELILLVRRVAYKTQDPNNLMNTIVKWIDIEELGVEFLNKPTVFVIPLTRGDMFNKIGGDYGYHFNLNKLGYPSDLQPIGVFLDNKRNEDPDLIISGYKFEDIGVECPRFYQMPIQIMLTTLSIPVANKTHAVLARSIPNEEIKKDAFNRACHAWYVYNYEKCLADGTLDPSSEFPVYNPQYTRQPQLEESTPTPTVTKLLTEESKPKVTEVINEDLDESKFWSQVRTSTRD